MSRIFRNSEFKKSFVLWMILSAAAVAVAFLAGIKCGIIVTASVIFFNIFHIVEAALRYRRIADLCNEINDVLFHRKVLKLDKYNEGELSILYNEICKMTDVLIEQSEKLKEDKAYMSDSLADISHQIRTPLTSLNLITEFLSEPDLSEKMRQNYTKQQFELLDRIDWLINTLLKISKIDAGTIRFDIKSNRSGDIIQRAVKPVEIPMELKGVKLETAVEDFVFDCDIMWTVEALENIVKNCYENTPSGGKLTITARKTAVYVQFVIRDTGRGVAKEDLPHIFERFYKGKNSATTSVGIGLALSRMIITAQNGTIRVKNCSEGGAEFEIRFYRGVL